jgi:hypothetical protein
MEPVVNSAPSEARNTTALATSSAVATRPSGLWARIASPSGPSRNSPAISVSTNPGATVATRIPYRPRARASDWPSALSPALLAP